MEWMYATKSCLDFVFFFRNMIDLGKSRMCELPDDIIISIISYLTIKEAIATSVLSRRWRHMWKYTTDSWKFNLSELCDCNDYEKYGIEGHGTGEDYVNRVNQALESHRGPFLYELGFCMDQTYCPLAPYYTSIIDSWISIASRKCVRRLDLNTPDLNLNKIVQNLPVFSQLTHLNLNRLQVTEETICYFLSSCLLLEHLCVLGSSELVNLKVGGGSSLKLKHLEISDCRRLRSLEVSAPNLVSFACRGQYTNTLFKDVPLLSTLSIEPCFRSLQIIEPLSYFSQIESLTLELSTQDLSPPDLELSNLKHLEVRMELFYPNNLRQFTFLLKASPLLSSLKIDLGTLLWTEFTTIWEVVVGFRTHGKVGKEERLTREPIIYPHQCLRVVTLYGFLGYDHQIDLALHLIGMATSLEKMVIDCSRENPNITREPWRIQRSIARQIAKKLRSKLPPATEFVVI